MNKTIKVIDLLNKIVNKEELPKKIKYFGKEWILINKKYYHNGTELFEEYLENSIIKSLNDKVEIIEDEDINIQGISVLPEWGFSDDDMRDVINNLIKAVKKLDKEINNE